jgi:hypothetical protein
MWREFDDWEDFLTVPTAPQPRRFSNRFEAGVNRCAERLVSAVMAAAPYFYAALVLAYLGVCLGIIS